MLDCMQTMANKLRLSFDIATLTFTDIYPEKEMREVMSREEFETILRRINVELADELHENAKQIRKWFKIVGLSSIFIVGIFLLPILLHKSGHQATLLLEFQDDVKEYLYKLNKRKYLKRHIEWRLVKDRRRKRNSRVRNDATNSETQLRIEIVYETGNMHREEEEELEASQKSTARETVSSGHPSHEKHAHHHHHHSERHGDKQDADLGVASEIKIETDPVESAEMVEESDVQEKELSFDKNQLLKEIQKETFSTISKH